MTGPGVGLMPVDLNALSFELCALIAYLQRCPHVA